MDTAEEISITKLLKESAFCRLCGEENESGINIFQLDNNGIELSQLINRYLPVKVKVEDEFPKTICPGCHIQLEATKLFVDLIITGQARLRELYRVQREHLSREERQRQKLEEALKAHNPNTSVETYTIQTDETGEKYIIQIFSDGPLFPPEHELTLKAEGLEKPKRKRGRPPKPPPGPDKDVCVERINKSTKNDSELEVDSDGRRRRKIKTPLRFYEGVVHGKEMDKMLKKEGVLDDEEVDIVDKIKEEKSDDDGNVNIIGTLVTETGDFKEPILHTRRLRLKSKLRKGNIVRRHKRYQCKMCKKEFLHFGTYRLHLSSHKIRYACKHEGCSIVSEELQLIQNHQLETCHLGISVIEKISNADANLEVPLSDKPDQTADDVLRELSENPKEKEKEFTCELCDKQFSCKQSYEIHFSAVHAKDRPFKCEQCGKSFPYALSLKAHNLKHEKEKNASEGKEEALLKCDKCDKSFFHMSSLGYHRDTQHNNGRRFVCGKCNKSFKHRQLLLRHQLVHSDDRPFQCNLCFQAYKTKHTLVNHQASVHSRQKKFVCVECGQNFSHRTSLTQHQRWHEGYKPFECDVCHKYFSQKGNLAEHKRIHTGEKPYCCGVCGKSFTTSSQYKLHIKRHTGEKSWTCEYCGKAFLHRETWRTHLRRHLNERPFKCKSCPRAFTESWALRRHERLHSGIKPFTCFECGKSFSDSSNFSKHKKAHKAKAEKSVFITNSSSYKNNEFQLLQEMSGDAEETTDKNLISILEPTDTVEGVETEQNEMNPLELRQVLDPEGNPISFTTSEGQPISIVSTEDNQNIQGLMPDGSLISIDLGPDLEKPEQNAKEDMLNNIQYLTNEGEGTEVEIDKTTDKLEQNIQFFTDDGKVCFITYDENELLTLM